MYSQYNCAPKVLELRHILAYPAVGFDDEKPLWFRHPTARIGACFAILHKIGSSNSMFDMSETLNITIDRRNISITHMLIEYYHFRYMGVSENGVYPAWNTPELILDTDD